MGCCLSRASGPNSPYPGGIPNGSARHINPPPLTLPESAHPAAAGSRVIDRSQPHERRDQLTEHINKPLRLHRWSSVGRKWTKDDLRRERIAYFDTRVTGRAEVWQALHAALEILWSDEETSIENADSLQTAQTILTAAEISLPTGNLADGAYDSLGNYYPLPDWAVSTPRNIIDLADEDEVQTSNNTPDRGSDSECQNVASPKGKNAPVQVDRCRVFARLSETGHDVSITFTNTDTVKHLAAKIAKQEKLGPEKRLRLAYMGKMLNEKGNLEEQGWVQGHIINALVFER